MEQLEKHAADFMDGFITHDEFMHVLTIRLSELACDYNPVSKAKNAYKIAQRILWRTH